MLPTFVEHLDDLDVLLVLSDDGVLRRRPPRVDGHPARTAHGSPHAGVGVPTLPPGRPWRGPDIAAWWRRDGAVLTAALQVGVAAWATDLAVGYAKQRHQFGRPIGGFQAVKHLCADMAVRAEVARCAVQAAAVTVDQPDVGDATGGRGRSQAAGRRGGDRQRAVVHPGPRRHGVHLGGPGPPGLQAGPGPGHASSGRDDRLAEALADSIG